MPVSLVLRDLDRATVLLLEQRAELHNRTVELEILAILKDALQETKNRSPIDPMANMPNVGLDEDFDYRRP